MGTSALLGTVQFYMLPGGQLPLPCRPPALRVASCVQGLPQETKLAIAPLCHTHNVLGTHDTILPLPAPTVHRRVGVSGQGDSRQQI